MTVAYRRRKMDAAFRAEWIEMIAIGYHQLEAVLLDRAFNGTEKVITRRKPWTCSWPVQWRRGLALRHRRPLRWEQVILSDLRRQERGQESPNRSPPSRAAAGASWRRSRVCAST